MCGYSLHLVQLRLEQSKLEKLQSRKRVKASLEARRGVTKPLVKSLYTSASKQVKGGQAPRSKLSCKFIVNMWFILSYLTHLPSGLTDEDMAKMVAEEEECALEAARGQEKEHQVMACLLISRWITVLLQAFWYPYVPSVVVLFYQLGCSGFVPCLLPLSSVCCFHLTWLNVAMCQMIMNSLERREYARGQVRWLWDMRLRFLITT